MAFKDCILWRNAVTKLRGSGQLSGSWEMKKAAGNLN